MFPATTKTFNDIADRFATSGSGSAELKTSYSNGIADFASEALNSFMVTTGESLPIMHRLSDPTSIMFRLFFHFGAKVGLLADDSNKDSALAFLNRVGETWRYDLLRKTIDTLSEINSSMPWMFQSIEGIGNIVNRHWGHHYINDVIDISTLEAIDFKIAAINNAIKMVVFDDRKRLFVLPPNLRKFSMSIYIYDSGVYAPFNKEGNTYDFLPNAGAYLNPSTINHILIDLGNCTLEHDSGNQFFKEVSVNPSSQATNNLKIRYEQAVVSGLFRTIYGETQLNASLLSPHEVVNSDRRKKQGLQLAKDYFGKVAALAKPYIAQKISTIADQEVAASLDNDTKKLSNLYMGNVSGFSLSNIQTILQSPNPLSSLSQLSYDSYNASMLNDTKPIRQ